jgi:hypothetical protein
MSKIIIILDSQEGHITHVFTSDPKLDVRIVDIDTALQDPVVGPYDPNVTVVVADVDAAAREYIKGEVPDYQPEEEEDSDRKGRSEMMVDTQGGVLFCLYGHGECSSTECPACADGIAPRFIPMRTFEYDLEYYGGNYADVGATILIPETLLGGEDEEVPFEQFTGLHRCHIVSIRSEEDEELEGDELAERITELEEQQRTLLALRAQHSGDCPQCQQLQMTHTYDVYLSGTQAVYQNVTITSEVELTAEQLAALAIAKAQDGNWEAGDIDQSIDVDEIKEGDRYIEFDEEE